jgi:hypothetical protein
MHPTRRATVSVLQSCCCSEHDDNGPRINNERSMSFIRYLSQWRQNLFYVKYINTFAFSLTENKRLSLQHNDQCRRKFHNDKLNNDHHQFNHYGVTNTVQTSTINTNNIHRFLSLQCHEHSSVSNDKQQQCPSPVQPLQTATCRPSLLPTFFADRGESRGQSCGPRTVVNLSFLDRSRYFSFK